MPGTNVKYFVADSFANTYMANTRKSRQYLRDLEQEIEQSYYNELQRRYARVFVRECERAQPTMCPVFSSPAPQLQRGAARGAEERAEARSHPGLRASQ